MHKHYLLSPHFHPSSTSSSLHSLPSPKAHKLLSDFGITSLFFRVLSNLNKRRSGIWILLRLIKGRDLQLSSLACSLVICQRPVFKKDASPQD